MDSEDQELASTLNRLLGEHLDPTTQTTYAQSLIESYSNPELLMRIGRVLQDHDSSAMARLAFNKALKIDPQSSAANLSLGILDLKDGDNREAAVHFEQALVIQPRKPVILNLLGFICLGTDDNKRAVECFKEAVRLDPMFEEAFFNLGVALRDQRSPEALEALQNALRIDPSYSDARREIGYVLLTMDSVVESKKQLSQVLSENPQDAWAHIYLGTAHWRSGDLESAMEQFRKAAEIAPTEAFPLWSIGSLEQFLGHTAEAQSKYEAALNIDPESPVAVHKLLEIIRQRESEGSNRYELPNSQVP